MRYKIKAYPRKVKAKTKDMLEVAIAEDLDSIKYLIYWGGLRKMGIVHNKSNCYKFRAAADAIYLL